MSNIDEDNDEGRNFPVLILNEKYLRELIEVTSEEEKIKVKLTEDFIQEVVNLYESNINIYIEGKKDVEMLIDVIKHLLSEKQIERKESKNKKTLEILSKIQFKSDEE